MSNKKIPSIEEGWKILQKGITKLLSLITIPLQFNRNLVNTSMNNISIEEGWKILEKGITKAQKIAEDLPEPNFTVEENMMLYTCL